MVDLSQDQPLKQRLISDAPATDQPPVDQQATQPKKQSFTSSPKLEGEEKIATPKQEEIKKELSELGVPTGGGSKKTKVLLATLGVLFLLATLPAAVYLVKQRQEIRKEAAPGVPGDMTCLSDVVIGPGAYSFAANGVGLENRSSASFTINLPAGATPLADYAYAFWSGEKKNAEGTANGQITINGQALTGEKIYSKYNEDWNNTGYIFRVKIPSSLITGTSLTFNISGLDLPVGVAKIHGSEKGGAHGVGIVVPYEKADLPASKIIIRSCGDFVYHNKQISEDYSDPIVFNFSDISDSGATLKAAFFFGEGEGPAYDNPRPNFLWYNNTTRLNPTDGTAYPGYSSDDGFWWDTRVTGEDLPAITASGITASFKAHSPIEGEGGQGHGDSFYFIGGILQYPVISPTPTPTPIPLTCIDLEGTPDPSTLSPGDEITLRCVGTSDPSLPVDHFEFRVTIDDGIPIDLGSAPSITRETTDTVEEYKEYSGYIKYTIPDYACYKFECRVCTSSDSSDCTIWGQAGKIAITEIEWE